MKTKHHVQIMVMSVMQLDLNKTQHASFNMLGTKIGIILYSRIHWTPLSSSSTTEYRHGFRIRGTYSLIHNSWFQIIIPFLLQGINK